MQKLFTILSMLILASCTSAPRTMTVVDVSPIKTAEVTIVQDKTTKHELLSVLGAPSDLYTSSMVWRKSANPREYFDVKYVQNDGTAYGFCVGERNNCKGNFTVHYKQEKGSNSMDIVKSVSY